MTDSSGYRAAFGFALVAMLLAPPALAQVGVTTDIITGTVTYPDSAPIPDVLIEALSLETQITRTTRTDSRGRFSILFPDGGGQYRMSARKVGLMPYQATLVRYADEDRLVWNVRLSAHAVVMTPIEVQARLAPVRVPDRPSPGSTERVLTPAVVQSLPIDPDDLNVLATLVPGVVGLEGTDSSAAAFSVAGQRGDANALTLDGMTFGSGQVPQEGLRATRIITSTYDVSRGRFSGGLIAGVSRSGTNNRQGSLNYSLRDDDLSVRAERASAFTAGFSQHRVSGGIGGPIVSNRLFAYVSAQGNLRADPLTSLSTATPADLERLGVSPDSVARFLDVADRIGAATDLGTGATRSNDNLAALARLDYLVSANHTLTLRGDWQSSRQDPTRVSWLGVTETGGVAGSRGGGVMASLASRIGLHIINEGRVYVTRSRQNADPLAYVPQGRVQVASVLPDGSVGQRTLQLGGNAGMPSTLHASMIQLANDLSWLPGRGAHRFKFGGELTVQRPSSVRGSNRLGTYTYQSIDALESGTPASFRRTLVPAERASHAIEFAAYAGDAWRVSSALQLTYGLRLEHSSFRRAPLYNAALDSALGFRTDRLPSEWYVGPRVGFTWTAGGGQGRPPAWIVRGGAGSFRSPLPLGLVTLTQTATGLANAETEFTCIGPAVPAPDWNAFAENMASIPDDCLAAPGGAGVPRADRTPTATVFHDAFGAPKAWRASLGAQRALSTLLRLSVDAAYARGTSQYGFSDVNLDTDPDFRLQAERNRAVYVPTAAIVPASGAMRLADSRIDPGFGQVLQIGSDLASDTKQLTVSLSGFTRGGIRVQTSYTWSHARDQSSTSVAFGGRGGSGGGTGGLGSATTGGNPNRREWSRSSYERRHAFLATVGYPFGTGLEVTAIARVSSGTPYTPMVGADINGDGSRNDRAFVFAPSAGGVDPVADGMARLLAVTSGGARACLMRQVGAIARRNSCVGPWQSAFDLQVNARPRFLRLAGRLTVSAVTVNLLRGIDELLHGAQGAKGWGGRARPDETLLVVEGFDPVARMFRYAVNERFGATGATATAVRAPFQIGIQLRFSFGPDRQRDTIDRLRGGARGLGGGRGFAGVAGLVRAPDEFLERFESLLPNPAAIALAFRDTLHLTDPQVASLESIRDSLVAANDSLATELKAEIDAYGTNREPRGLLALIQPKLQEARINLRRSVAAVRAVLTPEQWALLPEGIREIGVQAGRPRRPGN
ncbi:MAG TPA: carboxypeptidase regulatory-like domain-containing protein [Gemmatimonadales bacterium]